MESSLGLNIPVEPQPHDRMFRGASALAGASVGDYWRWAYSDIVGNTHRGLLAQFIVAKALGDRREAVDTWEPYDVVAADGTKVEVKSAAYVQSWSQRKYSRISFGIARSRAWNPRTGDWEGSDAIRHADVYVFSLLTEKDKTKVDPLDLQQWEFYVLSTAVLDSELSKAKTISLERVRTYTSAVGVAQLENAVGLSKLARATGPPVSGSL